MFDGLLSPHTLVLIALAVIIGIYLSVLDKRTKSDRSAALCKTYEVMTEDILLSTPDETLVEAVIGNLMSRLDTHRPDLAASLPFLSQGRANVCSVWLLCHELRSADLEAFFASSSCRFAETAVRGLDAIGAALCAELLGQACEAAENADAATLQKTTEELRNAMEKEQPLQLCISYIRCHPADFID